MENYRALGTIKHKDRIDGIELQIEALEAVLDGSDLVEAWEECYREDKRLD